MQQKPQRFGMEDTTIINNQTMDLNLPDDAKLEELIKWRLEAVQRKLNDRIQACESKSH